MRPAVPLIGLVIMLGHAVCADAQSDSPAPVAERESDSATDYHADLDEALDEYETTLESEVGKVITAVNKVFSDATQRGDLALAKKARAVEKRLREDGEPPTDSFAKRAREEAQRNINRAARKLEARYGEIAKAVLKTGDLDTAEAIVAEAKNIVSRSNIWKNTAANGVAGRVFPRGRPKPYKVVESTVGGPLRIEMVRVGEPGNPPDSNGFGSVSYEYRIGKYEITIEQYCAFLNAAAKSDPHELFDSRMHTDASLPSIERSGADGSFRYSVMRVAPASSRELANNPMSPHRPIGCINWHCAARFCNWLHNGQGAGDTESGAYTLNSVSTDRTPRQPGARFFIPSEDEWYKAAYYGGPQSDGKEPKYFQYATQHDEAPAVWNHIYWSPDKPFSLPVFYALQKGDNVANWARGGNAFDTLAPVNHFPLTVSRYGCNVMTGNLEEVVDGGEGAYSAVFRGGQWWEGSGDPSKGWRSERSALARGTTTGFRIAAGVE